MSDRPSMFDLNLPCDACGKNLAAIHVCSGCNESLREALRLEQEKTARLAEFKRYVHQRLDEAGIPVDPPSVHRDAGCRVGGRLDIALTLKKEGGDG